VHRIVSRLFQRQPHVAAAVVAAVVVDADVDAVVALECGCCVVADVEDDELVLGQFWAGMVLSLVHDGEIVAAKEVVVEVRDKPYAVEWEVQKAVQHQCALEDLEEL
jgi:hypothetical protein